MQTGKYDNESVEIKNKYGHPNKEVLNNLDNSKIYRTDQDGSIMFKIKNNKLEIKTYSHERLPNSTKNKIINQDESNIVDFVKNPIRIKNNNNREMFLKKYYKS